MAGLPSYEEATTAPDWLELVASYVSFSDYRRLSLVSRRFWTIFAPRLWENPLKAVRLLGLDPSDDVSWWFDFVFNKLSAFRPAARSLVRVLDATQFAKESYHFPSDRNDRNLQLSFARALQWLPNTECILLDGHVDLDLGFLIGAKSADSQHSPMLLSIADCPFELPGNFFRSTSLSRLVYLDISAIPGSIKPVVHPGLLPALRILKVRGRELDDASLRSLVQLYGHRLWSLDISENRITDGVVDFLRDKCFPKNSLRTSGYFYTEGDIIPLEGGSEGYGSFVQIQDSQWSKNFNHPERFFIDSPAYEPNADLGPQEHHVFRANGQGRMRKDSSDEIVKMMTSHEDHLFSPSTPGTRGLTHLNLSNNLLSASGITRLIRTSNGQIEYLACDSMPLLPSWHTQKHWPIGTRLVGTIGDADIFRPVFSSNLRALRIHHSFVTGLLDLEMEGFSSLARLYLGEKLLLPRIQSLFSGAFRPDMNPRLTSLVLTHVPRRSSGPLITTLLNFLRLLSEQESAIEEVTSVSATSRRAPDMLSGMRHLRLEFDPDPMEEGYSAAEDLDAEDLMNSGDQGYSFFEGEQYEKTPVLVRHGAGPGQAETADTSGANVALNENDLEQEYVSYESEWDGESFTCQVWLGSINPTPKSALYRYRQLVRVYGVRDGVGPAHPSQVRAGAPEGSYIFHVAWTLAIMPSELSAPPKPKLAAMKDVLEVLKRYRLDGRSKFAASKRVADMGSVKLGAPHYFWTGKLEVSTQRPLPQGRAAQYWR